MNTSSFKALAMGSALALTLSITFQACESRRSSSASGSVEADSISIQSVVGDNSENSVDWAGTYWGVLPCADCPGIRTSLTLREDQTFKKTTFYLDRDVEERVETGTFTWNEVGSGIQLVYAAEADKKTRVAQAVDATSTPAEQYLVGENQVIALDGEGKRIEGAIAPHFVLKKEGSDIREVYWELVEIRGNPVDKSKYNREPFIRLTTHDSRIQANGGCNNMGGTYELNEAAGRIKFSQLMSTKMACPEMDLEQALADVLQQTDSYHLGNDTLQLFKARMAPLAKFRAKYSEEENE